MDTPRTSDLQTIRTAFSFLRTIRGGGILISTELDAIDELLALDLIQAMDEVHFRFTHNLTMEVAFREAGEVRQRILHHRLVTWVETAGFLELVFQGTEGQGQSALDPARLALAQSFLTQARYDEAIGLASRCSILACPNTKLMRNSCGVWRFPWKDLIYNRPLLT